VQPTDDEFAQKISRKEQQRIWEMAQEETTNPGIDEKRHGQFQGRAFGDRFTWTRADLDESRCFVRLTDDVEAELDRVAAAIAGREPPVEIPDAAEFDLQATGRLMSDIGDRLFTGLGFAVLDRLPVDRWGVPTARSVACLLTSMLGSIVEQKVDGTRVYDVQDKGKTLTQGVRRSITNLAQEFHTDGGWLPATPEIVVLACLQQAKQGGMSQVSSLATAHDRLLEKAPALLARLYEPMWWDRQAEHAEGEPLCSREAIFTTRGDSVDVRYYDDYVKKGHAMMEAPLDSATEEALAAFRAEIEAPEHCFDFFLSPGQMEFVNNRTIAHARTQFEASADSDEGRHLIRLWVRRTGGTALEVAP
jgi:alpha-ketoglutarate-dependent taurine dioxygenase